ncbi:hypothetical protein ACM25N_16170 [Roseovarius sp. C7]|uniref:hypothetical protein n=1 Tax=Roseovarius sp. C7 TaxID=3398643 RepID=UPI0039F677C5
MARRYYVGKTTAKRLCALTRISSSDFRGIVISIGGWIVLLNFAGVEVSYSSRLEVINIHRVSIANHLILAGYFLILCGLITRGFEMIAKLNGVKYFEADAFGAKIGNSDLDVSADKGTAAKAEPQRYSDEELAEMSEQAARNGVSDSVTSWKRSQGDS